MAVKKLAKNAIIYSAGNFLPKAVTFLLLPIYSYYLTPHEYGIVNSMQVFTTVLMVILTLGLERSLYRLYYEFKTEDEKRVFLGTVTISLYLISVIVIIILFLLHKIIGNVYKSIPFEPYYIYAILTAYFSVFLLVPKIFLQIKEKAQWFILINLSNFLLQTLLVLFFIVIKKQSAIGMLKGLCLANAIMSPFLLIYTLKIIRIQFQFIILKKVMIYSLPIVPSLISAWVINLSDRVFLERYFSTDVVGVYAMGYKISSLVQLTATAILMAYNPYFYKLANSENQDIAKQKLYVVHNINILILMAIGFSIVFISKDLITLFVNASYGEAIKYIPIVSASYFFMQLASLQNLAYYQKKKTVALMVVTLFSAIVNLALNFLLIPDLGAMGAALATLATQFFFFILQYVMSQRYYFIPYDWKLIIPTTFVALIILIFTYYFIPSTWLYFYLKLGFLIVLAVVLYLAFKKNFKLYIA